MDSNTIATEQDSTTAQLDAEYTRLLMDGSIAAQIERKNALVVAQMAQEDAAFDAWLWSLDNEAGGGA